MLTYAAILLSAALAAQPASPGTRYFKITVVDEQTGRGVPLVELETTNGIRYYTDSNGTVAFYEPGLMNQSVFFTVRSHGYEFPKDGFGITGRALDVTEGGSAVLKIKRINIAERLYRITGGGIYRDTVLLGERAPIEEPVLNGKVMGQDSVLNAVYKGKLWWFWGDTGKPSYPLGNFNTSGATSLLPADGGLDPDVGVNLTYFVDKDGFARAVAPVPGQGPTWIGSPVVLRRSGQKERMFAVYAKIRDASMETWQRGLAEYNDDKQQFDKVAEWDLKAPCLPGGHTFRYTENDTDYICYVRPFPLVRIQADPDLLRDPANYEGYSCLKPGSRLDKVEIDRDERGRLRYGWKKNTPPLDPGEQAKLIKDGHVKPGEVLFQSQDVDTGKAIQVHGGSVYWNDYRRRWAMIMLEVMGTTLLGEVWYTEADTPLGPWVYARKIVTHDKYSFYNVAQHPQFDKDRGRVIYFEGTYTVSFSGNPAPTPRYEYNQIMYKLDVADPRLALPAPVYDVSDGDVPNAFAMGQQSPSQPTDWRIAFFAPDRPAPKTIPVYASADAKQGMVLTIGPATSRPAENSGQPPLFYALPADTKTPPATTTPLTDFVSNDGSSHAYSTDASWSAPGYRRVEKPLCLVWRSPYVTN